jgi:hypothetical protein
MLPHDMQRNVFNVDNPPARGSATMNFISAPHRSHFRAGFSSVLSVPITEHYARSARTWLQNVELSHNQKERNRHQHPTSRAHVFRGILAMVR